jgi:hypothetical protein
VLPTIDVDSIEGENDRLITLSMAGTVYIMPPGGIP